AVSQARIARRKLLIRVLPLAGRAPLPDFFEIDDDPPSIDLPEPAAPAADRPETGRPGTGRADPAARDWPVLGSRTYRWPGGRTRRRSLPSGRAVKGGFTRAIRLGRHRPESRGRDAGGPRPRRRARGLLGLGGAGDGSAPPHHARAHRERGAGAAPDASLHR